MTSFSFTEFLGLVFFTAWTILQMCWFVVIPVMAISLYLGIRGGMSAVWMLISLFILACVLIPLTGEGGSGALIYMSLPFVVPLYVLPFFGLGQLLRHRKRRPIDKDIIEVR